MELKISTFGKNLFSYYFSSPKFDNVLILPGLPYVPCKKKVAKILEKIGLNAILLHYRGSWGSRGEFGEVPHEEEVRDFLEINKKVLVDGFTGRKFFIKSIDYAMGFSYGGLVALKSSHLFKKVVSFAPPLVLNKKEVEEALKLFRFFGNAFKLSDNFSIDLNINVDSNKVLVIHGKKDDIVELSKNKKIYEEHSLNVVEVDAGHYPSTVLVERAFEEIKGFFFS